MMTMDQMLTYLLDKEGSDLHLMAGLKPAIRRHGDLEPIEGSEPFTPESVQQVIYSVLSEKQIKLYEEHPETRNELDFAYSISGMGRFRFNVHAQRGTVAAVVRALATEIPTLESLKMPPSVAKFAEVRKGLVLVTGPTGSGKSTTLAALIDLVNRSRADHIITIEDPIEYIHNSKKSYVTQREVGLTADTMSFKNALKYSLRQDPDVILVGELRDYETIGIAITSAETGHLVFGTLHTPSAAETIGRIIDVFPGDQQPQVVTQLSSNLVGVVAQILLPTLDGKGRAAAVEIMVCNSAIRNQIRTNSIDGIYQSIQTGIKQGMMTMDQSIANLVREGRVAYEVANPYIRDESTHRQLEQFKTKNGTGAAPRNGSLSSEPSQTQTPEPASNGDAEQPKPKSSRMSIMNAIPPWEKK